MKRFSFAVFALAGILAGTWGTDALAAAHFAVTPTNLVFQVLSGNPETTSQTVELRSLGGGDQSWYTSLNWPQLIRVEPSSGILAGYAKTNLTVTALASNAWPSQGGYAGDITIGPWGDAKVSFQINVGPSARLVPTPGSLGFGMGSDGFVLERALTLRNSGYDTPGAELSLFDGLFEVVKDPGSGNAWSMWLDLSGQNLTMTNNESRVFPVRASFDWSLPPGRYGATLTTDAPWELADPLSLPLTLVVGADLVGIDQLMPVPGTTLAEQSKVVFQAQMHAQVQSVEEGDVRLIVYDPGGVSAIGYSDWVTIDRAAGVSNLVIQTPPVTIYHYSNVVVKAAMRVLHDWYDWVYSDAYIYPVMTQAALTNLIAIGERLQLPGVFNPVSTNHVKVLFERSVDGTNYVVEAPIEALTALAATVRVPVNLLGPNRTVPPTVGFNSNVVVRVITGLPQNPQTNVLTTLRLVRPRLLIHDEVFVPPAAPAGAAVQVPTTRGTLLQFMLNQPTAVNNPATVATLMFFGYATDGRMGLRALNTALGALATAPPLHLAGQLRIYQPTLDAAGFEAITPFTLPGLGADDAALQFDVVRDGLHLIVVGSDDASSGPFPAPFQIHLAGNVGLPRKLINGQAESPRGTRLDTLFNHPAPRTEALAATLAGSAETAPYKFANLASVAPFAVAVLVPPAASGFPAGARIVRALDPLVPLEVTTPTARTPGNATPTVGMVLDFTQLPDPASVVSAPPLGGTVGAVLGQADGSSVTLPMTLADGTIVSSLILDMGSGHEIADGAGADFRVVAPSGSYTVAVANTPYAGDWVQIGGTWTGQADFDLNGTGLGLARFVRIAAAPTVALDAVHKLNLVCDAVDAQIGPLTHVTAATILVRRAKAPETPLDPFVQLIAPNGELYGENDSGFGDDLSQTLTDAALIRLSLPTVSLYRYLVKGYDQQPGQEAIGTFFTRLETDGQYDPVELTISALSEAATTAQKRGRITQSRQRDSFLFQANPGTLLHIAVNALTPGLDPRVELYDPEDYLFAANDNGTNRGRDALLTVALPLSSVAGLPLPAPSTYRVVVSAMDAFGPPQGTSFGAACPRVAASGDYELKVFTGDVGTQPGLPRVGVGLQAGGSILRLNLEGTIGSTVAIETRPALGVGTFSTLCTLVLTNRPHVVDLPLVSGSGFYRLRLVSTQPSSPRLGATLQPGGTVLRLSLEGDIGSTVVIETRPALGVGTWSTLSTLTLTNRPQVVDLPLGSGSGFYRLKVQ